MDRWFKRTFGEESRKRLLMLFLEALIPERKIANLTYVNGEHINMFPEGHIGSERRRQRDLRNQLAYAKKEGIAGPFCRHAPFLAIVYSLFSSCKAAGIEPREWLQDILVLTRRLTP